MKQHFYTAALLGVGILAAATSAHAQTADRKTAVGLHANATQYRGDLGNNFWEFRNMPYSGGIDITRYVGKVLDVKLDLDYLRLRSPADEGTSNSAGRRFQARAFGAGLGFKIKAPVSDQFFLHPYVLLEPGFAWVMTDRYASPTSGNSFTRFGTFTGQVGIGLDFLLGPSATFFVQGGQAYLQTSDGRLDGVDNNATSFWDKKDRYLQFSAGLRANLGKTPDTDGDGVADKKDKCPGTPTGVKVDAAGCPLDTDGDGVPDYLDRCPNRPGPASNKGCPEIKVEDKQTLNEATKYIHFAFDKATLTADSYPRLNQLVTILNDYPDYNLSIAGHTDSEGDDAYNLRLSYERAAAARTYLLSKGILAGRIEARGYGETKPIAPNDTDAGRARNRRVDFDSYLTGEANAAEAKYGPAPTISELHEEGKTSPTPAPKTPPRGH